MAKDESLPNAIKMRLASMDDLIRMAFFSAARNHGLNFLLFQDNEKWFIGFLTGVAGYFDLRGLPMFFYFEMDEKIEPCNFIRYESIESEKWSFCKATPTSTKWTYLPVIQLAEKPHFF